MYHLAFSAKIVIQKTVVQIRRFLVLVLVSHSLKMTKNDPEIFMSGIANHHCALLKYTAEEDKRRNVEFFQRTLLCNEQRV
jgi:hypothetical protein